ncbi:hypothetical protein BGZ70_007589 [Mortierella alpina]|uniref:PROP1-like PPR domain-containing protein n=1 Tax=Mortierella alpina TaxID=64518 RepID=A0A9P6J8R4_MORAP|nr:hypothetical protein BGZ70_007589 [Mortierella alpina]
MGASVDQDHSAQPGALTPVKSRPAITSFLAPPGTERPHNPHETIADSLRIGASGTSETSGTNTRCQSVFSGRDPSDFDPVSPRLMMNDAVNSRNAQQIWHTYTRLVRKNKTASVAPFTDSQYFRILRCFQATNTVSSAKWARTIYEDMKVYHTPKITTLNTMLDLLIRHEDADRIIELFRNDAALYSLAPNVRSYNIMIRGLATQGQIKVAQQIYSDMRSGALPVRPNVATYSTLMSMYAKRGMQNEADRMLDQMFKDGVKPNMWIFNSVIKRFVSRRDYAGARKVISMMGESEMRPDVVTYSTLIDGYARDGNQEAIAEIQAEMAANQIYPNARTITSTIKVFARSGLDTDIDDQLEAVLRSLPQEEMREHTFGVLMNVYGKRQDLMAAMGIFNHMKSKGRPINDVIVNSLLDGYVRSDQFPTAVTVFHDHFTARNIRPSTSLTYNIMITGCCKQGDLHNALHYYHEMNSFHIEPDAVIFSRLVQLYLEHHQLDNAHRMLRLMRNARLKISVHTFTMLMDYMSNTRDIRGALRCYQEMLDLGVQPDVHCYTVLMNAQIRARNYAGCSTIYEHMLEAGVQPTLPTLTTLIRAYALQGNLDKVKEYWEVMTDSDLVPDLKSFTVLMRAYGQLGNIEMAEFIFKEISRKQIKFDALALTTLTSIYCALPRLNISRIDEISAMMEELELEPTPEYFKVLFDSYGEHGMPDRVIKTWRQLQGLEKPLHWMPTTSNLLHLIEACRDRGYVDTLQAVWRAATLEPATALRPRTHREEQGTVPVSMERRMHRPMPEVFTAYLNALLTHNRFSEIEELLDRSYHDMGLIPRTEDLELLFTGLAQYGFLKKELDRIQRVVAKHWPDVVPMVDKVVENTRRI